MGALLAVMLGSLVASLRRSLWTTRDTLAELERVNAALEATVKERTAEVQRTSALLEASQRLARVGGTAFDPATATFIWTDELYHIHEVPLGAVVDEALFAQIFPAETQTLLRQAFQPGAQRR